MDTTTALTILGSFGAASTAQIVSHALTLKRENKNYQKARYQHLYSPTIFKLTDYIKTEGNFIYNSSSNPSEMFNEIMNNIGDNLKYTSVDMINLYQIWKRNYSQTPSSEGVELENEMDLRINLAYMFFTQFIEINKSLNFKHKIVANELKGPYFFAHFFLLIKECTHPYSVSHFEIFTMYDLVEEILSSSDYFIRRIVAVRKKLDKVHFSNIYQSGGRVQKVYLSAYELLYDIADAFADINEKRASDLKEIIDSAIRK
ncbi:hypothetical protein [Bacillus thuringiensis]|uniref:hypothetical protein n=1 Tax=Bacillus thuringiensis TaxID=1428 RepID=UPI000BFB28F9|nr:hypothetical protein [Bacillus thuringiensis]PGS67607.1 hypothetical protein COD07_19255 [Bacillus thuringiensis]